MPCKVHAYIDSKFYIRIFENENEFIEALDLPYFKVNMGGSNYWIPKDKIDLFRVETWDE